MLHQSALFNGDHLWLPSRFPISRLPTCNVSSSSLSSFPPRHRAAPRSISCCASSLRAVEHPIHNQESVSERIVGVVGGDHIGRMMRQEASQFGLKVAVLDAMENSETVDEFAKRCDLLMVEIGHVDATTLEKLEKDGVDLIPKASTIKIIQDKFLRKVHLSKHDIPLPELVQINDLESAEKAGTLFGYPLMIKSNNPDYIGRGNAVVRSKEELPLAVTALGGYESDLYLERWAKIVKELAVVVAKGRNGSIMPYPVVETIHKENICHKVKSPACVSWKVSELATTIANKAISSLEGAGVFTVQLFLTEDDQILLNEVAVGPCIIGHHTIESCYTSQYEQHLRAVIGLPLGDPSMKTPAAIMYNIQMHGEDFLLGDKLMIRAANIPEASVHWYDKPEMRDQGKMGYITVVGSSMENVESLLLSILDEKTSEVSTPSKVEIIMGSVSDCPVMEEAAKMLEKFGVQHEVQIISAHRTPEDMYEYAKSAHERGVEIIIAGAGGAAHLPGMVAALTPLPVIGVPIASTLLQGIDALLSILQMPKGTPVATVGINNSANAALLAMKILSSHCPPLRARLLEYTNSQKNETRKTNGSLKKLGIYEFLDSVAKQSQKTNTFRDHWHNFSGLFFSLGLFLVIVTL